MFSSFVLQSAVKGTLLLFDGSFPQYFYCFFAADALLLTVCLFHTFNESFNLGVLILNIVGQLYQRRQFTTEISQKHKLLAADFLTDHAFVAVFASLKTIITHRTPQLRN